MSRRCSPTTTWPRSLAPDGRLGGLLAAFAEGAPAGSAVRAATCLAVDPDLVATAAAMRQGYAVRGPNGTVPGTGADVAGTWLDTLAAAARGGCVVALPFADADLVALARGQLGDLGRLAVADAGAVVTEALGTPVLDATTWPSGGVLDEPALAGVADAGARAVVLDASTVDGDAGTAGAVPVAVGSSSLLAVLTDPLLARAADAPEVSAPAIPGAATTVSATTVRQPRARRWPPRTRPPRSCSAPRPRSNRPAGRRSSSPHPTCGARTRRAPERCSPP